MSAKVFISCGQSTKEEIQAAEDVETWFKAKGFAPYVARKVITGITDLNKWVIEELKSSDYFVFINFAREEISASTGSFRRGSVYANQELAVAASLGFEGRMILVNERRARKEGIFKIMVSNTGEFDTFGEIVPIIESSVTSARWDKLSFRHLSVKNARIVPTLAEYHDHDRKRYLYIAHIDVTNSRPDIPAADCTIRLVKIERPGQGEQPSPDRNALKVTGTERAFRQNIWRDGSGTFDLFGIDALSYPDTYLLSESDVTPRSAIISTREKHILTYEISAKGFPEVTARIALDFGRSMPTSTQLKNISYSGSGHPQFTYVVSSPSHFLYESDSVLFEDPDSTPKVTIESVDRSH